MTQRERLISVIQRNPVEGLVPHFELAFFLTMEAFGKVHPLHRNYSQWDQMSEAERRLHREDIANVYIQTAETYGHSAIFIQPNPWSEEETLRLIERIREKTGDRYFLMVHGDATMEIPAGGSMQELIWRIADEPERLKADAAKKVDDAIRQAERFARRGGLDCFALCSDYCFNNGPFLSPAMFSEFIAPYLARLTGAYRDLGFYVLKHTDGNIMPILDQLVQTNPHILHSIDPQAGVELNAVKQLVGDKVCLMGNVNCGLMQTGSDVEAAEEVRRSLREGLPGGGYLFSTSNCIYSGMPIRRYEMMLEIWKQEGAL